MKSGTNKNFKFIFSLSPLLKTVVGLKSYLFCPELVSVTQFSFLNILLISRLQKL